MDFSNIPKKDRHAAYLITKNLEGVLNHRKMCRPDDQLKILFMEKVIDGILLNLEHDGERLIDHLNYAQKAHMVDPCPIDGFIECVTNRNHIVRRIVEASYWETKCA
jgi:hypothetical protein